MNSYSNESNINKKQMKIDENKKLNGNRKQKNEWVNYSIYEKKNGLIRSQNIDSTNNSYSLLNVNQEVNETSNISKKKKKIIKKKYFKNIYKRKSIIGICLNFGFWAWLTLYILNYNSIIIFPRGSLEGKRVHMIYSHNPDGMNFITTLLYTFLNHFMVYIYPEVILFATYCAYVVYTLFNTECDKFKEDIFFLSKNTYVIFVILSLGEIYKLFARRYLDI